MNTYEYNELLNVIVMRRTDGSLYETIPLRDDATDYQRAMARELAFLGSVGKMEIDRPIIKEIQDATV